MVAFLTILLLIAVSVLGFMLADTRARLKRIERQLDGVVVREEPVAPPVKADAPRRKPAVIIRDESLPPPPSVEAAPQPVPAPLPLSVPQVPLAARSEAPETRTEPAPRSRPAFGLGFEDLFGRKLPIWAGGITLAVAGVLLVKYSIDAGLLSPFIRVMLGLVFGLGLIGGAEAALRAEARVGDPRIRQALSGAGIASLYAAILAASNLYALIGPATAFVGLAAVTALAMGLSVRFGAPSALLGLVGGLAAPALVGAGPPNVPLLSAYLALAIGGLTALSRQQRWMWLGVSALIGGAGWGGVLILTGALDVASSLSLGMLVLLLGLGLPFVAFSGARTMLFRLMAAIVAAAQIAALVAKGGFAPLQWGLYLLLAAAMGWLAWREPRLRPLPPVGLAIGLLLATLWPQPPVGSFVAVILLLALVHAGPALLRLWRQGGGLIEAGQIAAVALAGHGIAWVHYPNASHGLLAALAVGAAALPAVGAALGWRAERQGDARFVTLVVAAALLLGDAAYLALPLWLLPVAIAVLTGGLAMLAHAAADRHVDRGALAFLGGSLMALLATDPMLDEVGRLAGETGAAPMAQAAVRWAAVALGAAMVAWRVTMPVRAGVEGLAAIVAYGAIAQLAPGWSLPVIAALSLLVVSEAGRQIEGFSSRAAATGFGCIALAWAAKPLVQWLAPALFSIMGEPMFVTDLPSLVDGITRLAIPAAVVLVALWRTGRTEGNARLHRLGYGVAGLLAVVAAHSLYKHGFSIGDHPALVRLGLAERSLWEALLLGLGWAAWRWRGWERVALVAALAALLHMVWYSLILFDPLVTEVAVGPFPVANLLVPMFAVPFAALWILERTVLMGREIVVRVAHVLRMILIVLFAAMTLRQLFCGSLLVGTPVGSVENISQSVLAIALAIGFLVWGIRTGRHDWRIGSLVLMLAAVAKVFLLDAAGLEGLLRIASFLALGFSLIGLGWLYSRFLRREAA